jgi:hypothetical protein
MADDVSELPAKAIHDSDGEVFLHQFPCFFLFLAVFPLLLLPPLLDERLPQELQSLWLLIEVDEIVHLVLLLAYHAGAAFQLHLLQGLPRHDMSARPEGHELVEPVVLQLADGAGDVVGTVCRGSLDDDLYGEGSTFLMSVSLRMYAYLSGSSLRTREESRFS